MENQKTIKIGNFEIGNKLPLAIIAGPCQIESRQHAVDIAGAMVEMTKELGVNYIFKASYDKANRTSLRSPRGVGIEEGMKTFDEIKKLYGCPILTDVHEREQCAIAADNVDMLQIPAFWDMKNLVMKSVDSGNPNVCLTERGTCFGYNTLVTDMRAFPQMAKDTGCPIIFDATHSVQQPGGLGGCSGGQREFAPVLARAAVAVGVAAVFMETHENPDKALSDGPNSIALKDMKRVISELMAYDKITKTIISDY